MPTYDYECDACGHRFELFQKIGSAARRTCPECKKRRLRRLIGSGSGVIFKGSGFYETDYRSADYRKRAEAESKGTSGGEPSKEGKTSDAKKSDTSSASGPPKKAAEG